MQKIRQFLPLILASIAILAFFILTFCNLFSPSDFLKKAPKELDAEARHAIDLARAGDIEGTRKIIAPEFNNNDLEGSLATIRPMLHPDEQMALELIGYGWRITSFLPVGHDTARKVRADTFAYQASFDDKWAYIDVTIREENNKRCIYGYHVNPLLKPLQEINGFFYLAEKPIWNIPLLIFVIALLIFNIYCLYKCVKSNVKRKWLWLIFIAFGVGQFNLNWTTGAFLFKPLFFQLLGVGITKEFIYGPWTISFSLPIAGALFILLEDRKKHQALRLAASANEAIAPEDIATTHIESPVDE